jgi:hypothetical protein
MSKRKAGDKLNENTKESRDAKNALSTSQRNKQIREEIGNDPERLAERLQGVDRNAYDFSGFDDKQINMAFQGGKFGDEDYARLTGKKPGGDDDNENDTPTTTPTPTTSPGTTATPSPSLYGDGGNSQQVSNTYGDVSINGDGNNVDQSTTQNIDNSITYGDSNRYFNYKGGDNGGVYDTPVSMATMAGYYDVDDSPKATHQFLNKYVTANNLAQKGMRDSYKARTDFDYKAQADQVNQFNPKAMQERIDREPLINRSRSKVDFAKLFGDVDNGAWAQPWTPTTAPAKIESEVGDIAKEYKDELD